MSIKTNSLDYVIDKQKIEEKYDIFCLETSEKYIKRGAYILDVSVMCNDIKAIKFESGRKMLLLMSKNLDNKRKLKELLGEVTDGDKFSVLPVAISELKDHLLIQLLLNALGSYDSEFLKCNNLTGHLYCFHPYWIKRGKEKKEDIIWQVPCLEITVTEKLYVNLAVRTFTSERLKKKISFTKRKFEDYPKYIFSANNTLRRRLKGEEETCFILRQLDDRKTTLPFLEFQSLSKYEQSKMGVLNAVITTFNDKYEGICRLGFRKEPITQRVDYSKTVQRENIKRIKNVLNENGIHIVDQINDANSDIFCENIRTLLRQKYEIETTLGKRVSRDKLNIVLIHNAEYYNGVNDPHDKNYEGVAVQHITFENFSDSSEFAIATVMHEVIIKKDLEEKKISLFDWEKLGFTEPISFGMETEGDDIKHYFIMTVSPDGTFEMREQEMTLFEMNEYTEMIEIFEQARTDSEMVKGVIRFADGSMNVIKDYYSYIVVDEAHHAVAPMLKRVIQYYAPEFLVGLTATDQRPDKKRLEEIFGNYTTELSLKDAMEKGVVARANVYRIETNIDLSHVRFNGKDYVNADLEKSVRVTSRNELIVNVLKDYFTEGDAGKRQGMV